MEFLKNKGTLGHFIDAKITGDDEMAKWTLLKAGKKEIRKIEKDSVELNRQQDRMDRIERKLRMYGQTDKALEMLAETSRYSQSTKNDGRQQKQQRQEMSKTHGLGGFPSVDHV